MHIYYGPGYTERNVMESMNEALHTLADGAEMLQGTRQHRSSRSACCSC